MFLNCTELSKCRLFNRIPVQDIPKAVKCLKGYEKTFQAGETVYYPGMQDFHPGIVERGQLQINQINPDGSSILLKTVEPGEFFGFGLSFRKDEETFLTATETAKILFLHLPTPQNTGDCTCQYRMIILENLIFILAGNNCLLNDKIQMLTRHSLREKLMLFFRNQIRTQHNTTINLTMTREKLAQSINAERSAVSRELSRMEKDGLIRIENRNISILTAPKAGI